MIVANVTGERAAQQSLIAPAGSLPPWTDDMIVYVDITGVVTKFSPRSVEATLARLRALLAAKGLKEFVVIDQRTEAEAVGLDLRATTLVVFGNPTAGTPVMAACPLSALDLPLKVLIWEDDRLTKVSYTAPATLAERYGLPPQLAASLGGIDALTDALVAD